MSRGIGGRMIEKGLDAFGYYPFSNSSACSFLNQCKRENAKNKKKCYSFKIKWQVTSSLRLHNDLERFNLWLLILAIFIEHLISELNVNVKCNSAMNKFMHGMVSNEVVKSYSQIWFRAFQISVLAQ